MPRTEPWTWIEGLQSQESDQCTHYLSGPNSNLVSFTLFVSSLWNLNYLFLFKEHFNAVYTQWSIIQV